MSVTVPTVTGWQGFWSMTGDMLAYSTLSRTYQGWRSNEEWRLARIYNKPQMREIRALQLALLGATTGGTASSTYKNVSSPVNTTLAVPVATGVGDFGGTRDIDTNTVISRATIAADVTYLTSLLDGTMARGNTSAITFVSPSASINNPSGVSNLNW